jgi:hypothetical protein
MIGYAFRMLTGKSPTQKKLKQHFGGRPLEEIVTAARTFPLASRVDVQLAIDQFFSGREKPALLGIHSPLGHYLPEDPFQWKSVRFNMTMSTLEILRRCAV